MVTGARQRRIRNVHRQRRRLVTGVWRPGLYDFAPFGAWDEVSGSSGTWGCAPGFTISPRSGLGVRCRDRRVPGAGAPGFTISPRSGLGMRGVDGRIIPGARAQAV